MKVHEAMTKDVAVVAEATPLKDVARLLAERRISGVPVVDGDGVVVGVVSETDIVMKVVAPTELHGMLGWMLGGYDLESRAKLEARTAGEAMTAPARTIGPSRSLDAAASEMTDAAVNRLPVVDGTGRPIGILTRGDLVRAFARSDVEIEREIREEVISGVLWLEPESLTVTVADGEVVLSGEVPSVSEAEMAGRLVRRVPGVIDVESRLTWRERNGR